VSKKGFSVIKRISLLATAALLALALAAPAAFAVSPAEQECLLAGGDYDFSKGDATCTFITETNPSGNTNPNAATPFTETDTTTQPGQGGGGGETSTTNQNFEEVDGPVLNGGGNAPAGQQ